MTFAGPSEYRAAVFEGLLLESCIQQLVTYSLNPRRYSSAKISIANNPGKFIVATQGKVKSEGAIVVTMVINDKVDAADEVKAGIKRIKFVKGR